MLGVGAQNNKGDVRHFPLILYKSQLQFVFSDYQLLPGNFKIEIRETGGGVKQEFDYIDGYIDKASIQAFVGANSGYISAMYEQKTGVKVDVTVEAQQRQIINAGVWGPGTAKYNLEIPVNSTLAVSGIAALNRLKNLSMCSYIGFKGSISIVGYTPDYVFPMKMSANSLNDFGITNGLNLLWYFRDNTTSGAARPAVTCVSAGTDYLFCTNMLGNIQLASNGTTNKWIGSLKDLPRFTYYVDLFNVSEITDDVIFLPRVTFFLAISAGSKLTGLFNNVPSVTYLYARDCSLLSGTYTPKANNTLIFIYGNAMTANETDQTLINCASVITAINGDLRYKNNRTAASNAAVAILLAKGWTLTAV